MPFIARCLKTNKRSNRHANLGNPGSTLVADTFAVPLNFLQGRGEGPGLPGQKTPGCDHDCEESRRIEEGQATEHRQPGAFPEKVNEGQAGESDRHHGGENAGNDPDEDLDQTEFLLLQLDPDQLKPILKTRQEAVAEGPKRIENAWRFRPRGSHGRPALFGPASDQDSHEHADSERDRHRLVGILADRSVDGLRPGDDTLPRSVIGIGKAFLRFDKTRMQ